MKERKKKKNNICRGLLNYVKPSLSRNSLGKQEKETGGIGGLKGRQKEGKKVTLDGACA